MEYKYANAYNAIKPLNAALGQRSKVEILRCLSANEQALGGREIARRCGLSHLAIHRALRELEEAGLIERRIVAPNHQFKLNKEHWLMEELMLLFQKEALWLQKFKEITLRDIPDRVYSVILYGSSAAGKARARSDIDLLILVQNTADLEAARAHFQSVSTKVYASFHRPLSILVLTEQEFQKLYRKKDPFAQEVSYFGQSIHGKLITEVLFKNGSKKN